MSQRFIRCAHCGLPHDVLQVICPATGKAIRRGRSERRKPPDPPARASASTATSHTTQGDLLGKTIGGKYLVRSILGEGGMGTVFEAEHATLGRSVALKVLHPNQARKRDAVRRFHQEARAAGAIGHPNICEVYDLGTLDDGSPYLVMEKLLGETLADRIAAEGGLPFDDVVDILVQVLSGLVAAHEKGIVHRDIKPENVFLTRRVGCPPVCKLLDFGVSKMIAPLVGGRDEELDLTRTGMVMGTPYYMSPEQARGDRNLDARVDLYACGVILYETLTGKRPFTAANYNALLLQILSSKPRPARELRPALPSSFDAVIEKAMARSRDDRYPSAADFQRDLQSLRDRHHPARPSVLGEAIREVTAPRIAPLSAGAGPAPAASPLRAEPTPSSVEIPIVVSSDTPMSGENVPIAAGGPRDGEIEATALRSQPAPRAASDASEFEEYPTQVKRTTCEDRSEDASTTQRRGAAFGKQLVAARQSLHDTDRARPTRVRDTDATGTPAPPPKRRARRPSSPDDTLRVDTDKDSASIEGDPTQLMASRTPKARRP